MWNFAFVKKRNAWQLWQQRSKTEFNSNKRETCSRECHHYILTSTSKQYTHWRRYLKSFILKSFCEKWWEWNIEIVNRDTPSMPAQRAGLVIFDTIVLDVKWTLQISRSNPLHAIIRSNYISANCSDFLRKRKSIFTPEKIFAISLCIKLTNTE